ncbi:protein of unknown function [Candidatus Nitrosocosmicus franklandus]|uniref:Uncharacterized protein n=1 Tax=Candidatus Nitrosocosmicus franklandianus TaxID=1798806 RepID=A0A484IIQ7_9ARCH|nr:protein of unknown function [Candidatus Nitrosocosmicus franklandus]
MFFKIDGRCCTRCQTELDGTLDSLNGVKKIELNYITNIMMLQYDASLVSKNNLVKILESQCNILKVKRNNSILEL